LSVPRSASIRLFAYGALLWNTAGISSSTTVTSVHARSFTTSVGSPCAPPRDHRRGFSTGREREWGSLPLTRLARSHRPDRTSTHARAAGSASPRVGSDVAVRPRRRPQISKNGKIAFATVNFWVRRRECHYERRVSPSAVQQMSNDRTRPRRTNRHDGERENVEGTRPSAHIRRRPRSPAHSSGRRVGATSRWRSALVRRLRRRGGWPSLLGAVSAAAIEFGKDRRADLVRRGSRPGGGTGRRRWHGFADSASLRRPKGLCGPITGRDLSDVLGPSRP
jgi:hypothetical protein